MTEEERDRELSALIDGELSPERERELRREIASDPALAQRVGAFESVDEQLRALEAPALPADLRARLDETIASDSDDVRALRPVRWAIPLAAAAVLLVGWFIGLAQVPRAPTLEAPGAMIEVADDQTQSPQPDAVVQPAVEDASDVELAIAFELDTLRDLDMIEELDLLEALLAIEETKTNEQGRS
ncbi:MAG: hypothetical protein GY944_24260 [bacterium]|nr:hypothetical protein [bacterium]MCP5044154.1 hypothetical protein [bacterium]